MRLSRILLLVVALVAGGLAAFLATRPGDAPVEPGAPVVVTAATTQVLVATTPIGVGERLSAANMAWQDWPETAIRDGYFEQSAMPDALTEMEGTVARFEIFEGDPIRQQKLVRTDQGYLSAVLDKGKRGVSIAVTADSASGGFIVPNDHVDVILTRNSNLDGGGQTSETILSNVRVLAINTRLGEIGTTGAPDDPNNPRAEVFADSAIATLELEPPQAEIVASASQTGRLSLALRSIVDFAETSDGSSPPPSRNAPIKIIRYGVEANVMSGATPAGTPVDPASFSPPPVAGPPPVNAPPPPPPTQPAVEPVLE